MAACRFRACRDKHCLSARFPVCARLWGTGYGFFALLRMTDGEARRDGTLPSAVRDTTFMGQGTTGQAFSNI